MCSRSSKTPRRINSGRSRLRYTVIKLPKANDKHTILKAAKDNQLTYRESSMGLTANFLSKTLRPERDEISL